MFKSVLAIFLKDLSIIKFILGVIAGLAFSISVVLGTIGIMDGFETTLKEGLRKATGEIYFYSSKGLFEFEEEYKDILKSSGVLQFSTLFQTEGFVIKGEKSRGVLVKGIDFNSFLDVTNLKISINDDEIAIGSELAKALDLKVGEELAIALANGNRGIKGLPEINRLRVGEIITHGIYEKDLRITYVSRNMLQKLVNAGTQINSVILNAPKNRSLNDYKYFLKEKFNDRFIVKIFWEEYSSLIEAVGVEKKMIGLIFQLVVIISIFNVFAFIIFLNERKAQEIFLLKALGMPNKRVFQIWLFIILGIWVASCFLSVILIEIFGLIIGNLSILQIPGEIYHLGQLKISLFFRDYFLVFGLSLLWLLILFVLGYSRLKTHSILEGLRKEFI
jgi:ABC-type lipoprotein release transport system permease subunit